MSSPIYKPIKASTNTIFRGDNLGVMRAMPNACIDLCYIDPPYYTQREFKNNWGDKESILNYHDVKTLNGFKDTKKYFEQNISTGEKGLAAYLVWMRLRLIEIHRLLKDSGSFYIQVDYRSVHYLKVILDEIFGYDRFRNEISWKRGTVKGAKAVGNQFARNHDTILFYTKGKKYIYNRQFLPYDDQYIERYFRHDDKDGKGIYRTQPIGTRSLASVAKFRKEGRIYKTRTGNEELKFHLKNMPGIALDDLWLDIPEVNPMAGARTGWTTQKPLPLLERIISASSNAGQMIFDCFAGCGTAMHAAHNLKRKWIGIDISPTAIKVSKKRLEDFKVTVIDEHDLPQ